MSGIPGRFKILCDFTKRQGRLVSRRCSSADREGQTQRYHIPTRGQKSCSPHARATSPPLVRRLPSVGLHSSTDVAQQEQDRRGVPGQPIARLSAQHFDTRETPELIHQLRPFRSGVETTAWSGVQLPDDTDPFRFLQWDLSDRTTLGRKHHSACQVRAHGQHEEILLANNTAAVASSKGPVTGVAKEAHSKIYPLLFSKLRTCTNDSENQEASAVHGNETKSSVLTFGMRGQQSNAPLSSDYLQNLSETLELGSTVTEIHKKDSTVPNSVNNELNLVKEREREMATKHSRLNVLNGLDKEMSFSQNKNTNIVKIGLGAIPKPQPVRQDLMYVDTSETTDTGLSQRVINDLSMITVQNTPSSNFLREDLLSVVPLPNSQSPENRIGNLHQNKSVDNVYFHQSSTVILDNNNCSFSHRKELNTENCLNNGICTQMGTHTIETKGNGRINVLQEINLQASDHIIQINNNDSSSAETQGNCAGYVPVLNVHTYQTSIVDGCVHISEGTLNCCLNVEGTNGSPLLDQSSSIHFPSPTVNGEQDCLDCLNIINCEASPSPSHMLHEKFGRYPTGKNESENQVPSDISSFEGTNNIHEQVCYSKPRTQTQGFYDNGTAMGHCLQGCAEKQSSEFSPTTYSCISSGEQKDAATVLAQPSTLNELSTDTSKLCKNLQHKIVHSENCFDCLKECCNCVQKDTVCEHQPHFQQAISSLPSSNLSRQRADEYISIDCNKRGRGLSPGSWHKPSLKETSLNHLEGIENEEEAFFDCTDNVNAFGNDEGNNQIEFKPHTPKIVNKLTSKNEIYDKEALGNYTQKLRDQKKYMTKSKSVPFLTDFIYFRFTSNNVKQEINLKKKVLKKPLSCPIFDSKINPNRGSKPEENSPKKDLLVTLWEKMRVSDTSPRNYEKFNMFQPSTWFNVFSSEDSVNPPNNLNISSPRISKVNDMIEENLLNTEKNAQKMLANSEKVKNEKKVFQHETTNKSTPSAPESKQCTSMDSCEVERHSECKSLDCFTLDKLGPAFDHSKQASEDIRADEMELNPQLHTTFTTKTNSLFNRTASSKSLAAQPGDSLYKCCCHPNARLQPNTSKFLEGIFHDENHFKVEHRQNFSTSARMASESEHVEQSDNTISEKNDQNTIKKSGPRNVNRHNVLNSGYSTVQPRKFPSPLRKDCFKIPMKIVYAESYKDVNHQDNKNAIARPSENVPVLLHHPTLNENSQCLINELQRRKCDYGQAKTHASTKSTKLFQSNSMESYSHQQRKFSTRLPYLLESIPNTPRDFHPRKQTKIVSHKLGTNEISSISLTKKPNIARSNESLDSRTKNVRTKKSKIGEPKNKSSSSMPLKFESVKQSFGSQVKVNEKASLENGNILKSKQTKIISQGKIYNKNNSLNKLETNSDGSAIKAAQLNKTQIQKSFVHGVSEISSRSTANNLQLKSDFVHKRNSLVAITSLKNKSTYLPKVQKIPLKSSENKAKSQRSFRFNIISRMSTPTEVDILKVPCLYNPDPSDGSPNVNFLEGKTSEKRMSEREFTSEVATAPENETTTEICRAIELLQTTEKQPKLEDLATKQNKKSSKLITKLTIEQAPKLKTKGGAHKNVVTNSSFKVTTFPFTKMGTNSNVYLTNNSFSRNSKRNFSSHGSFRLAKIPNIPEDMTRKSSIQKINSKFMDNSYSFLKNTQKSDESMNVNSILKSQKKVVSDGENVENKFINTFLHTRKPQPHTETSEQHLSNKPIENNKTSGIERVDGPSKINLGQSKRSSITKLTRKQKCLKMVSKMVTPTQVKIQFPCDVNENSMYIIKSLIKTKREFVKRVPSRSRSLNAFESTKKDQEELAERTAKQSTLPAVKSFLVPRTTPGEDAKTHPTLMPLLSKTKSKSWYKKSVSMERLIGLPKAKRIDPQLTNFKVPSKMAELIVMKNKELQSIKSTNTYKQRTNFDNNHEVRFVNSLTETSPTFPVSTRQAVDPTERKSIKDSETRTQKSHELPSSSPLRAQTRFLQNLIKPKSTEQTRTFVTLPPKFGQNCRGKLEEDKRVTSTIKIPNYFKKVDQKMIMKSRQTLTLSEKIINGTRNVVKSQFKEPTSSTKTTLLTKNEKFKSVGEALSTLKTCAARPTQKKNPPVVDVISTLQSGASIKATSRINIALSNVVVNKRLPDKCAKVSSVKNANVFKYEIHQPSARNVASQRNVNVSNNKKQLDGLATMPPANKNKVNSFHNLKDESSRPRSLVNLNSAQTNNKDVSEDDSNHIGSSRTKSSVNIYPLKNTSISFGNKLLQNKNSGVLKNQHNSMNNEDLQQSNLTKLSSKRIPVMRNDMADKLIQIYPPKHSSNEGNKSIKMKTDGPGNVDTKKSTASVNKSVENESSKIATNKSQSLPGLKFTHVIRTKSGNVSKTSIHKLKPSANTILLNELVRKQLLDKNITCSTLNAKSLPKIEVSQSANSKSYSDEGSISKSDICNTAKKMLQRIPAKKATDNVQIEEQQQQARKLLALIRKGERTEIDLNKSSSNKVSNKINIPKHAGNLRKNSKLQESIRKPQFQQSWKASKSNLNVEDVATENVQKRGKKHSDSIKCSFPVSKSQGNKKCTSSYRQDSLDCNIETISKPLKPTRKRIVKDAFQGVTSEKGNIVRKFEEKLQKRSRKLFECLDAKKQVGYLKNTKTFTPEEKKSTSKLELEKSKEQSNDFQVTPKDSDLKLNTSSKLVGAKMLHNVQEMLNTIDNRSVEVETKNEQISSQTNAKEVSPNNYEKTQGIKDILRYIEDKDFSMKNENALNENTDDDALHGIFQKDLINAECSDNADIYIPDEHIFDPKVSCQEIESKQSHEDDNNNSEETINAKGISTPAKCTQNLMTDTTNTENYNLVNNENRSSSTTIPKSPRVMGELSVENSVYGKESYDNRNILEHNTKNQTLKHGETPKVPIGTFKRKYQPREKETSFDINCSSDMSPGKVSCVRGEVEQRSCEITNSLKHVKKSAVQRAQTLSELRPSKKMPPNLRKQISLVQHSKPYPIKSSMKGNDRKLTFAQEIHPATPNPKTHSTDERPPSFEKNREGAEEDDCTKVPKHARQNIRFDKKCKKSPPSVIYLPPPRKHIPTLTGIGKSPYRVNKPLVRYQSNWVSNIYLPSDQHQSQTTEEATLKDLFMPSRKKKPPSFLARDIQTKDKSSSFRDGVLDMYEHDLGDISLEKRSWVPPKMTKPPLRILPVKKESPHSVNENRNITSKTSNYTKNHLTYDRACQYAKNKFSQKGKNDRQYASWAHANDNSELKRTHMKSENKPMSCRSSKPVTKSVAASKIFPKATANIPLKNSTYFKNSSITHIEQTIKNTSMKKLSRYAPLQGNSCKFNEPIKPFPKKNVMKERTFSKPLLAKIRASKCNQMTISREYQLFLNLAKKATQASTKIRKMIVPFKSRKSNSAKSSRSCDGINWSRSNLLKLMPSVHNHGSHSAPTHNCNIQTRSVANLVRYQSGPRVQPLKRPSHKMSAHTPDFIAQYHCIKPFIQRKKHEPLTKRERFMQPKKYVPLTKRDVRKFGVMHPLNARKIRYVVSKHPPCEDEENPCDSARPMQNADGYEPDLESCTMKKDCSVWPMDYCQPRFPIPVPEIKRLDCSKFPPKPKPKSCALFKLPYCMPRARMDCSKQTERECIKILPPAPSFSECIRRFPEKPRPTECRITERIKYLQPRNPLIEHKRIFVVQPPDAGPKIDPSLAECCILDGDSYLDDSEPCGSVQSVLPSIPKSAKKPSSSVKASGGSYQKSPREMYPVRNTLASGKSSRPSMSKLVASMPESPSSFPRGGDGSSCYELLLFLQSWFPFLKFQSPFLGSMSNRDAPSSLTPSSGSGAPCRYSESGDSTAQEVAPRKTMSKGYVKKENIPECLFMDQKMRLPGCRRAQIFNCKQPPPKPRIPCTKMEAPMPSFSECSKSPFPRIPNSECLVSQQLMKIQKHLREKNRPVTTEAIEFMKCKAKGRKRARSSGSKGNSSTKINCDKCISTAASNSTPNDLDGNRSSTLRFYHKNSSSSELKDQPCPFYAGVDNEQDTGIFDPLRELFHYSERENQNHKANTDLNDNAALDMIQNISRPCMDYVNRGSKWGRLMYEKYISESNNEQNQIFPGITVRRNFSSARIGKRNWEKHANSDLPYTSSVEKLPVILPKIHHDSSTQERVHSNCEQISVLEKRDLHFDGYKDVKISDDLQKVKSDVLFETANKNLHNQLKRKQNAKMNERDGKCSEEEKYVFFRKVSSSLPIKIAFDIDTVGRSNYTDNYMEDSSKLFKGNETSGTKLYLNEMEELNTKMSNTSYMFSKINNVSLSNLEPGQKLSDLTCIEKSVSTALSDRNDSLANRHKQTGCFVDKANKLDKAFSSYQPMGSLSRLASRPYIFQRRYFSKGINNGTRSSNAKTKSQRESLCDEGNDEESETARRCKNPDEEESPCREKTKEEMRCEYDSSSATVRTPQVLPCPIPVDTCTVEPYRMSPEEQKEVLEKVEPPRDCKKPEVAERKRMCDVLKPEPKEKTDCFAKPEKKDKGGRSSPKCEVKRTSSLEKIRRKIVDQLKKWCGCAEKKPECRDKKEQTTNLNEKCKKNDSSKRANQKRPTRTKSDKDQKCKEQVTKSSGQSTKTEEDMCASGTAGKKGKQDTFKPMKFHCPSFEPIKPAPKSLKNPPCEAKDQKKDEECSTEKQEETSKNPCKCVWDEQDQLAEQVGLNEHIEDQMKKYHGRCKENKKPSKEDG